jgi:hypothetical protein
MKKKIKQFVIEYADGTKEHIKEGMLSEISMINGSPSLRVRTANFREESLQVYLAAMMHFISQNIDSELLDALEEEAELMETLKYKSRNDN